MVGVSKYKNDASNPDIRSMAAPFSQYGQATGQNRGVTTAFLIFSVIGALLTLNALRPVPFTAFSILSFFTGWIASELAPFHLMIHLLITAAFLAAGAAEGTAGTVAVVLAALTVVGLVRLIQQAHRVGGVVEAALCDGLGDDYGDHISPEFADLHDLRVPLRSLLLPFRWKHKDVTRVRNVAYGPYGHRNKLDIYKPTAEGTKRPVLFQIHGGGWVVGDKREQAIPLMLHMAARGWVCVAANYRLSPRATFPDHLVDLKKAMAWIREHIEEHGGDPDFVIVTGGSAGGHLTALVGLTQNDPFFQPGFEDVDTSVAAAVPYYGVYDFINDFGIKANEGRAKHFLERVVMKSKRSEDPELWRKASPQAQVSADDPPFFVIHGHHDSLVPVREARLFVERLRAVSKSPVVYAELPGAQHAFDIFPSLRTGHVIRAVERFLDYVYSGHLSAKVEVDQS
jgi:acetyl esterase/lipase